MSLIAKNVCKIYRNGAKELRAVDGITIEIEKNRSVAIMGPSGAGKSTLLHILGGLDEPTDGAVILDGADIAAVSDSERSKIRNARIGFVFQFYHLLPEFTALENVMMPALIGVQRTAYGVQRIKQKAADILQLVGLGHRAVHKPSELSGGEAQRVAIARALVNDPDYLLCDEPTGNLDSKNSDSVYELLFQLKSHTGVALVIVTHDESIPLKTENTIRIKDGKIV